MEKNKKLFKSLIGLLNEANNAIDEESDRLVGKVKKLLDSGELVSREDEDVRDVYDLLMMASRILQAYANTVEGTHGVPMHPAGRLMLKGAIKAHKAHKMTNQSVKHDLGKFMDSATVVVAEVKDGEEKPVFEKKLNKEEAGELLNLFKGMLAESGDE